MRISSLSLFIFYALQHILIISYLAKFFQKVAKKVVDMFGRYVLKQ